MLDNSRALNTLTGVMYQFGQIQLRAHHAFPCSFEQRGGSWVGTHGSLLQPLAVSLARPTETRAVPKPSASEDKN